MLPRSMAASSSPAILEPNHNTFQVWGDMMTIDNPIEISSVMLAFAALGAIIIGGLLTAMHLKHKYHPNLIGALIGALLCFLLIEALPAIT
ncbi:putative membrane protein [Burkholderia pseudomallei]|nr:putative membrane protein [Burkholderia pseudomallei]